MVSTCSKTSKIEWNVIFVIFFFSNTSIRDYNEVLIHSFRFQNENDRLNTIVASLRSQCKTSLEAKEELLKQFGQEKNASSKKQKEMEEKLQGLEEDLKDTEDLRQTILSMMMSKRKKSAKDS